jgi:hypothetical protein
MAVLEDAHDGSDKSLPSSPNPNDPSIMLRSE